LPYIGKPAAEIEKRVREGRMQLNLYYHELYFQASYYLLPKWGGSNKMVDSLARDAAAATAQKEKKSLYARVYWYLDQVEYRGKIFSLSAAKWADMKDGFDDLTGLYPDLWNLNAYAYFACMAQDYKTMYGLLNRIGDQLVYSSWGSSGLATYESCIKKAN
jgi:hypothetical protein